MWEILFGLFVLLFFGFRIRQFWRETRYHRRLLRSWQEAAGACSLQVLETSSWSPRLVAYTGSLTVTINGQMGSEGDRIIRIDVRFPGPPELYGVSIRRPPLVRGARGIESGDPHFDSTLFLEGPARSVLALLDAETRRLLTLVNTEGRLQISTDTLRVEGLSEEQVPRLLPFLLYMGQRLAQPVDVVRRLAENVNRDPEARVRLQNLRLLIRELPEAPETLEVLRTACSDRSPEIRLQAAQALGAEGRGVLLDLAESLVDDTVSAEAVSTLDRELTFERTKTILDQAQDRRLPKTAHACLEALGQKGASPGQLSVARAEAGQLALAPDDAGQLSLAPFETPPEEPGPSPRSAQKEPASRPV